MLRLSLSATALCLIIAVAPAGALETGKSFDLPCPFGDCQAGMALAYLGEFSIPTGEMVDGIEFGGISGLDFDASTGRYIAICDDRSEKGPARFYELAIDADASGIKGVTVAKTVTLKDRNGEAFAAKTVDPESVRIGSEGLYWSSEGDAKAGIAPFVRLAGRDGTFLREFKLPDGFAPTADKTSGIRNNNAFESMTLLPSGDLLVALEAALYQDGPAATLVSGSLARVIRYNPKSGEPTAQYVYPVSPIPQAPAKENGWNDNGLPELLALDDHRLLAVERGFAEDFGSSIKLFMTDLEGATDVSSVPSLAAADKRVVPLRKSELLDLRAVGLVPDNIEALTFAKGSDGTDLLILASDNNFNASQKTQFYAFRVLNRP